MRTLTLLCITLWLAGCNAKDPDDDEPDTLVAENPTTQQVSGGVLGLLPTHLMMETKMIYAQPGLDFTKTLTLAANTVSIRLPATIDVTAGGVGSDGYARLTFGDGAFCEYKGVTSALRPLAGTDKLDIEAGRRLNFYRCYDSAVVLTTQAAGDSVSLGSVTLKLYQGDTTYPETAVRMFLEVQ
jgi:hypothetical protein